MSLAVASLAWADAAPNPLALGSIDGVLTYCSSANPGHQGAYQALKVSLIGRQSDRVLDALEHTATYHQAYSQVHVALDSAEHAWVASACQDLLPAGAHQDHHGDDHHGDGH